MSSSRTYLGRVREVRTSYGSYHYALVEPVLESDEGGSEWIGPVPDLVAEFPTRGRVYWHEAPPTLQYGTLWQFEVEERPTSSRAEGPTDAWQVVEPRLPVEIIDLRGWDQNELRIALTGAGIPLALPPIAKRIALWIDDDHLLGPVRLIPGGYQESWVLDVEDASRIPVWLTPRARINAVECEGARLFLEPLLDFGSHAGIRNWCSDEELARTALRRLRKLDRATAESLQMTDAVFGRYVETLTAAGFTGTNGAIDRERVGRLSTLRNAIERDRTLLEEAAVALLETPAVASRVEALVEERVKEQIEARASDIAESLASQIGELEGAQMAVDELTARRRELERAVEEKEHDLAALATEFEAQHERRMAEQDAEMERRQQELDASLEEREHRLENIEAEFKTRAEKFESALVDRLRALADRPEHAFAEFAVLRAALGGLPESQRHAVGGNGESSARKARAIVVSRLGDRVPVVTALKQLQLVLMRHAGFRSLDPLSLLECHAACLAGSFPIVYGDQAEALVEAYAATVGGGRIHWVPVGPSVFEPQHLLGTVDASARAFVPHANGLVELLVGARASNDVHIVVFDGFNRAPVDAWLIPLLQAMDAGRRGRTERGVPLVARGSVEADDPYAEITRLQWPRNVLPIGIPTYGTGTLPLPPELWRFGALVDADRLPPGGSHVSGVTGNDPIPPSRVAAEQWFAWQDATTTPDGVDLSSVADLLAELPNGTRHLEIAARMMAALRAHELKVDEALRRTVTTTVLPRFTDAESVLERRGSSVGLTAANQWRATLDAAARLAG